MCFPLLLVIFLLCNFQISNKKFCSAQNFHVRFTLVNIEEMVSAQLCQQLEPQAKRRAAAGNKKVEKN